MISDFEVTITRNGDQYTFVVPAYGVVVHSPDIVSGYREAEARTLEVMTEFSDAGSSQAASRSESERPAYAFPQPGRGPQSPGPWTGIMLPVLVAAVAPWFVIATVLFIVLAPAVSVISSARNLATAARELSEGKVADAGRAGADWIVRVAGTVEELTPARKEELRQAVNKISVALAPFADELRPLFSGPCSVNPNPPSR